jgi:hypothetical protein
MIPLWAIKAIAGALILAALVAGYAYWRKGIYDEGYAARDAEAVKQLAIKGMEIGDLKASIREQNRAVETMGAAKQAAEARGAAARLAANASAARLDKVIDQFGAAKAVTCAEAMPTVDAVLRGVR